jgi:hypothetical protein
MEATYSSETSATLLSSIQYKLVSIVNHRVALKLGTFRSVSFVSVRFAVHFTQFHVTIATNCRSLTRCMNVSYVVGHDGRAAVCFHV